MRSLTIFLYEWKHLVRSPFKVLAILLFILASVYGLHNGADLYHKQNAEINRLHQEVKEQKETVLTYFDNGEKGPEERPWVDITKPFWSIRYAATYHFKKPSSAIVYNIGQAEQYGFYKKINMYSNPYDADMAKEIANPERIQSGTLDFAFVILFLMPLLLLVLLYNIKGQETERGFLRLVFVQTNTTNWWILSRVLFYTTLLIVVLFGLLLYGATLTKVFEVDHAFWSFFICLIIYLVFWAIVYFFILKYGKNIISNTLQMVGVWLLFAFIIPAVAHQWISIEKPTNLMVDLIDVKRDKADEIYELSDIETDEKLFEIYPSLKQSKSTRDTMEIKEAREKSRIALINVVMKKAITKMEEDNQAKNQLISTTYWISPISYFQNKLNHLSKTHYDDYQMYRNDIKELVDKRIELMVSDTWNDVEVDKTKYLEYHKKCNK